MNTDNVVLVNNDIPTEWYNATKQEIVLGVDIETSGLSFTDDRIACVQINVPHKGVVMVRNLDTAPNNLLRILEDENIGKIFHYGMFDIKFLVRDFNIWPRNTLDTRIAAKILDPNREKYFSVAQGKYSHSLEALIWHYFKFQMNKALAVSDWFAPRLTKAQIAYAANDVIFLPNLLTEIELELQNIGKLRLAREAYRHVTTKVQLELAGYGDVYHR